MDLVRVSLSALVGQLPWLLVWLLVAVALIAGERWLSPSLGASRRRAFYGTGWLAAVAVGLWFAYGVLWLCDDAYISFRYARNFADGHGLVFNVGEWVEGYTNFLWTWVLGLAGKVGADIPLWGLVGNLAAFVAALFFVAAAVRRLAPSPVALPFAAIALAASRPFYTFASSGLETMPAALWVAVGSWAATLGRGPLLSGLALTLAALTRPDHVLIYGCMGLALVAEDFLHHRGEPWLRRLRWQRILAYGTPFVLLYVPYFLWRWHAYGDFFPNTYYAKSGGETYYRQGIVYLGHFFWTTGAFAWLPILGLALWGRSRSRNETRTRIFAALALPLYGHYVVKVGGDFMEHRFFLSLLPIAAVALETGLRWRLAEARGGRAVGWIVLGGLAFSAAVVPIRILEPWQKRWHLADESSFYRVKSVFPLEIASGYMDRGLRLRRALTDRGLSPPIAGDSIGLLGYYSGLPIVDAFGLVNRRFAHKPIEKRGRPGHEKFATREELIEEGALIDTRGNPWGRFGHLAEGKVGPISFHFLRWDPVWAAELAKLPGARLPDPGERTDSLLEDGTRTELLETLRFYRSFLGEQGRETWERLERRLGAVTDFEGEWPEGARVEGSFRLARGSVPPGASGEGWAESAGPGLLEIPLSRVGRELRFSLAGSQGATVELVVDGEVRRQAVPGETTRLMPMAWQLPDLEGREALLRIRNESKLPLRLDAIRWAPGEGDVRERLHRSRGAGRLMALRLAEAELPPDDPDLLAAAASFPRRWTFEAPSPDLRFEGAAFGKGPAGRALRGQSPVHGFQGGAFLNSMHGGDRSTGRVELPPFDLNGKPIHLLVGGGKDCDQVYVGLEVDGAIVDRVCGKNDERLRPATLSTRRHVGKRGRVVIVDEATGGWGHILADDIVH